MTMQNLYNQLSNLAQSNKPGQPDANVTQRLGLPEGLLQDLRHDLKAVLDGRNPDKAVDNLLKGLQKFQEFVRPEDSGSNKVAKEWPADKEFPSDGIAFVMGKNGQPEQVKMPKEWPADKELPSNAMHLVKGKNGQTEQVNMPKEWPAGKELPSDAMHLVKGKNGQTEQVKMAKERPAGLGPSRDGIDFVMGKDGKPKQVSPTESQYLKSQASGSLEAKSDNVIANLKKFLDASANGENAGQTLEAVRGAIKDLVGSGALANNPEQVRKALMESIRANA
ncbi:hypothetical protein [Pseudomonas sp. Marseille-Q1929]|uniref:hypothetical protein n=1 Tax=Pseudomonas sp. Marseille-Q1929 TaxID=2730402 RepID=UPI001A8CE1C8|nr:hypothetical protein [Pseudomonas sp. Marseille-Q1929]MBO0496485.1 hypothetical protein [Pseudomonas sp. Marseille-Q1929]